MSGVFDDAGGLDLIEAVGHLLFEVTVLIDVEAVVGFFGGDGGSPDIDVVGDDVGDGLAVEGQDVAKDDGGLAAGGEVFGEFFAGFGQAWFIGVGRVAGIARGCGGGS